MSYVSLEKLIQQCGSLYKLVLGAAERANELNVSAEPLVKTSARKVTTIALEEILAGKVKIELKASKKTKAAKKEEE